MTPNQEIKVELIEFQLKPSLHINLKVICGWCINRFVIYIYMHV